MRRIADLKQRISKREWDGETGLRKKKNRLNSNNDHTNVIAQSITHLTNQIVEQTKTSKSLVEIKELCIFLVVKYSVADIDIPSRLSPSIYVDTTWHWLLLFPSVYASTCQRAYELAAIITDNDDFAYSTFPRVVDHNPNTANDLKVVKEQRRRATMAEMTRLGLSSITTEEDEENEEDETEEGTEEEVEEAEGDEEEEEPLQEEDAAEEEQESKRGTAFSVLKIRVKGQNGEETMFRIKNTTSFRKIMEAYASRKGVNVSALRFMLDGEHICDSRTIADLGLEDDDQVEVILQQLGC